MNTYQIYVTETLSKLIEVEAKTEAEALEEVEKDYKDEKIILDSGDFESVDISLT